MLKERHIICISCPKSCQVRAQHKNDQWDIHGHACKRGLDYVQKELTAPTRFICSTVKTTVPDFPRLPVKISKPLPMEKIFACMAEINAVLVTEAKHTGDVIETNLLNLDIDLIATDDMFPYESADDE